MIFSNKLFEALSETYQNMVVACLKNEGFLKAFKEGTGIDITKYEKTPLVSFSLEGVVSTTESDDMLEFLNFVLKAVFKPYMVKMINTLGTDMSNEDAEKVILSNSY